MSFTATGKVVTVSPPQRGTSKTGNEWVKQEFVMETTSGQFPRKMCFAAWGDATQTVAGLAPGAEATVDFDIESREYNGRWYTDLKAWRIKAGGATEAQQQDQAQTAQAAPASSSSPEETAMEDDLPF